MKQIIRRDKIIFFEKQLLDFFRKAGREHLPWRKSGITAYEVWVSEIMLQQTQVSRVIDYYTRFLKHFPTVEVLARASWEDFLPYYEGLGYYARGRNMLRAAVMVTEEHGGKFPRDLALLQTLPGVGPYTASAIMSFAYGDQHLAWDTNLRRVIGRFFLGSKRTDIDEAVWEKRLLTPRKTLNAALMDFGSALCVARPKCAACMLRSRCVYYQEKGKQEMSDQKQTVRSGKVGKVPKRKIDWAEAQVLVFLHENHKRYFSVKKRTFEPFLLPSGYSDRTGIKAYFEKRYGLTLAVRPPHEKIVYQGKPTLLVNAQILLGTPQFAVFSKSARVGYTGIKE